VSFYGAGRDLKDVSSLFQRQSAEVTELDHLSLQRLLRLETIQSFVESQDVDALCGVSFEDELQRNAARITAPLVGSAAPCMLDKDPPHGTRRQG